MKSGAKCWQAVGTIIFCIISILIPIELCILFINEIINEADREKTICSQYPKKEIVEAVFFHEGCQYTLFIKKENRSVPLKIGNRCGACGFTSIIPDVPSDKPMYVEFDTSIIQNECRVVSKIHIHSFDDVGGGAWNHGKFGNGQTVRISHKEIIWEQQLE